MNRSAIIAPVMALAAAWPSPAMAQAIYDAIGSTVANANRGMPESCLDGSSDPTPGQAARFTAEADPALRAYLTLAAAGADVSPAFTDRRFDQHWALDGEPSDISTVRDPWASRITRLELIGLRLGGARVRGRGLWRAFAADGTQLGVYDGLFRRKTRGFEVSSLALFSTNAAKQPPELSGFCYDPGDTEEFLEARAEREAERAARRAAREAARAARAARR